MTGLPLAGVRVLDLTRYIPGPYCTLLLATLGAEVVKVEEPGLGDPTRSLPPALGGEGALFAALNRGKRSVAVDLRREEGVAIVRRLAERADVLVEGFRPGVLARRGLGPEELLARNPRLVYCSMTGYRSTGEGGRRAGHDVNYAALAGFLAGNRDADGRPTLPAVPVADVSGALYAACAVLAALLGRASGGSGRHVEVPLADSVVAFTTVPLARGAAGGEGPSELMGTHACYNVYRCRDGRWVSVGALEPKFWEALCGALGLPHLASRQWEEEPGRSATVAEVARAFASADRDEWRQRLAGVDACVEPVLELSQVAPSAAPWAPSWPPAEEGRVPGLGEHTAAVLAESGIAEAEAARLREMGAVA